MEGDLSSGAGFAREVEGALDVGLLKDRRVVLEGVGQAVDVGGPLAHVRQRQFGHEDALRHVVQQRVQRVQLHARRAQVRLMKQQIDYLFSHESRKRE